MVDYSLFKRLWWSLLLCCVCSTGALAQQKITVAVAANMQYTIEAIKAAYHKSDATDISIVVGSSGKLAQQILQGAPFDIFISADTSFPQRIAQAALAAKPPQVYAQGILVLWSVKKGLTPKPDLALLKDPGISHIAIANPVTAPYGSAAEYILKKYNIYQSVANKLVTGESIAQASQFVATGAADIGFTAKSIVISDEMKDKGIWVELNRSDYPSIEQAAVLIRQPTPNPAAEKFYAFLFFSAIQGYLSKVWVYCTMIDWEPFWLTAKLACCTTLALFIVAVPLAAWLSGRRGIVRTLVEVVVSMPLVLPPSVIGFYLLLAFSPGGEVGAFIERWAGIRFVFSFQGLLLASMIYSLPFMVHPIQSGLASLPPTLQEAAWSLGKTRWQTLLQVQLPNIRHQLLTGLVLTFAHTVGEFGVVLMIGGNIAGKTRTASIAIFDEVEAMHYYNANVYALTLVVISFIILFILYWTNRRRGHYPMW